MNFLAICQDVSSDIGLQGIISTVTPSVPLQKDIVSAVKRAWLEIQMHRSYTSFMQRSTKFTTVSGVNVYPIETIIPPTTDTKVGHIVSIFYNRRSLSKLDPWISNPNTEDDIVYLGIPEGDPGYVAQVSSGGNAPQWWREINNFSLGSTNTNIQLNTLKNEPYTLEIIFRNRPQVLTDKTDIPLCPEEHHELIYHKAMMNMAAQLERASLFDKHSVEFDMQMGYLMRSRNPKKRMRTKRFI